jgi:hypothetical protein
MRRWPGAPGKRAWQAHAAMARRCGRARTTTAAPHAARPSWLGGHSYGGTATATSILRLQPRRPRGGLPALFPTMAPAVTVVGCQRISWPSSSMMGGWVTVEMNGGTTTARGPRSLRRTGWPELTPGVSAWPVQRPAAARRSQPVRPVETWRRSTTSPATRREAEAGELGQKASARTRGSYGERGVGERLEWDGSR